jgi:hypothetical protein
MVGTAPRTSLLAALDGARAVATHAGTFAATERLSIWTRLNTGWHERALWIFGAVVVLHWVEHVVQAVQIWAFGYAKPAARGLLGAVWPWLVSSEWLHYGFAVVMLAGLAVLLSGFTGRARAFWIVALAIQVWHLVEHQILFIQAQSHTPWFGAKVPTSVLQQFWPMARPEIHLVYNMLVTIPMLVALWFHMYPPLSERGRATACTCDRTARTA